MKAATSLPDRSRVARSSETMSSSEAFLGDDMKNPSRKTPAREDLMHAGVGDAHAPQGIPVVPVSKTYELVLFRVPSSLMVLNSTS